MNISGFRIDLEAYYALAAKLDTEAALCGSNTNRLIPVFLEIRDRGGLDTQWGIAVDIPRRSIWQHPGLLHLYHASGYCRNVTVLLRKDDPKELLRYLDDHQYRHHAFEEGKMNLRAALGFINEESKVNSLCSDQRHPYQRTHPSRRWP